MKENKIIKILWNKYIFIITLLICAFLNFSGIQNSFFLNISNALSITMKFLHFIFIYSLLTIGYFVWKNRKKENYKHGIIIFLIYITILYLFLLITWPGLWSWDDINVLEHIQAYNTQPWQHFITSIIQILFLQTFPFATGVLIFQILIIGAIIGYCVSKIASLLVSEYNCNKRTLIEIILCLPMFFSPVLLYTLSGFRMGLYSFFELLLITLLFSIYKEKKKIKITKLIPLLALVILISSWRTEGIYYLVFFTILLFILGKKIISKKLALISLAICSIFTLTINKVNNALIKTNNYSITAIIEPLQAIVKSADLKEDKKELQAINQVIKLNMIYENPTWGGGTYYWEGIVRPGYSDEQYKKLLTSYAKLMLKYPDVAFKSLYRVFKNTVGLGITNNKSNQYSLIDKTLQLFDKETKYGVAWEKLKTPFKYPIINDSVRNKAIRLISGIDKNDKVNLIYYIFRSFWIPFVLIFICLIYELIRKNLFMIFLILTVIARIPLVFLTSCSPYFMYYLSTYLISYFLTFIITIEFILKQKKLK